MTDEEYRKILSRNIRRIAYENHKSQSDIVRDLNLKQPTVSAWMNGTRMPKMEHIDLLCHYFNCSRADIMGEIVKPYDELLTQVEFLINKLNALGKQIALERLEELAKINDYTENEKKSSLSDAG